MFKNTITKCLKWDSNTLIVDRSFTRQRMKADFRRKALLSREEKKYYIIIAQIISKVYIINITSANVCLCIFIYCSTERELNIPYFIREYFSNILIILLPYT